MPGFVDEAWVAGLRTAGAIKAIVFGMVEREGPDCD
jgi:hypothetical protein